MKDTLLNLWFDIQFFFFTKKQKRAWRIKPWSWVGNAEPECYNEVCPNMSQEDSEKFLNLMLQRQINQTEFYTNQWNPENAPPIKPFVKS